MPKKPAADEPEEQEELEDTEGAILDAEDELVLEALEEKARIRRLRGALKDSAVQTALSELEARLVERVASRVRELNQSWAQRERERRKSKGPSATRVNSN